MDITITVNQAALIRVIGGAIGYRNRGLKKGGRNEELLTRALLTLSLAVNAAITKRDGPTGERYRGEPFGEEVVE